MWWKRKFMLICCSLALLVSSAGLFSQGIKAEERDTEGFIIEADRVVGSGMTASLVTRETSKNDGKPMLRFQYNSATIYGMKLTKQVHSDKGPVSITLKAKGPVTVYGMTVDASAISFKGACVKATETVPALGMENVVMVAHYMKSDDSVIDQLTLNTVFGSVGPKKPGQLKVLQDLAGLPLEQLKKEIARISAGHLPLTCEDGTASEDLSGPIGLIPNPLDEVIGGVTNPLDPILQPLDPVVGGLDPVLDPLKPVLDPVLDPLKPVLDPIKPVLDPVVGLLEPVTKPLGPVLKPLEPVLKPLEPVLEQLEPVVSETTEAVEKTVQTVCQQVQASGGVITKELGLVLIDEALAKKVPLNQVCPTNSSVTSIVVKLQESLLNTLGLGNLLGKLIPSDPMEQLRKMREEIAKKPDGTVIYKP
ncbi:hypothetical protein [Neobacillus niacini]|uniref:hypothetical protein n=1 Tax=Neobacillus niacini TaxID=86668 RepID=UPI0021CB3C77|nr:hypothetical protein [Neobacillus niacini]MCM3765007.1 hypothetical protein [Neobacillus niacini]